jgi:hypothetical protein
MAERFSYASVMGVFAGVVMVIAIFVIGFGPEAHRIAFGRNE